MVKMGIFNIIGIGLIVSGMIYYQFAKQFKKKAIRTTATITEIQVERNSEGVERYIVDVEFEVDGKLYGGRLDNYSSGMCKGGKTEVYYDPANPNKFKSTESNVGAIILILLGVFFLVMKYFVAGK